MAILGRARKPRGEKRRKPSRDLRSLNAALVAASARIREQQTPGQVMTVLVQDANEALGPTRATGWIADGRGPRLVASAPVPMESANGSGPAAAQTPPPAVVRCAGGEGPSGNPLTGVLTVPIEGPTTGVRAVLHLEGAGDSADVRSFVDSLAREAGLAMETAELREEVSLEREKSDAILGRIGDGVIVTDEDSAVSQVNEAAEMILGCSSADAIGKPCHAAMGLTLDGQPLDCSNGCALLREAEGETVLGREVVRMLEDGRRQPLLIKVEALKGPDGEVAEVVHSMRDITKLREADEAKSNFLATASHELKTPLTVILGYTDALRNDPWWKAENRNKALDAVQRRSEELADIVDRLLLSSRLEAGRNEMTVSEVELPAVLEERVAAFRDSTGRDVSLSVGPGMGKAMTNQIALTTVIDHLIDNSVKYSPDGGPIEVSLKARDGKVALAVSDKGIGMDAEAIANCTKKFWQAESSDERRFGGTGIGLYIVSSLVTQMGGELELESEPGRGTTFTILLDPAEELEEAQPATEQRKGPIEPEKSMVKEFMRQMGVPGGTPR
jgi:PAS domain S-box-containing protein